MKRQPCHKTRYKTKHAAREAIAGMARRWNFVFKRIYRCGRCNAYHISSKPPMKRRRR